MGWLETIGQVLKLVILILGEIFAAKRRARETSEQFELDQAKFEEIAKQALEKMRTDARRESGGAGRMDGEIDQELDRKE